MDKNNQQKLYGLDHLRAFAIIIVFLFHYFILSKGQPEWLPNIASFGWTGVDLFFVLSGFLISLPLFTQIKLEQNVSLKHFYLKRFFRIIPLFLFTVGCYFCFPFFREKEQLAPLWKFLSFTQNFDLNIKDFGTFSHAWSLCVEEHFYLLFPFILILLQKIKFIQYTYWIIILLLIFGFLIRAYSFDYLYLPNTTDANAWMYWYKFIYYPTYNRLDGLLIGISIAGIHIFLPNYWNKISKYGNHFIILSLVILTVAYFLCEDQMTFIASVLGFPLIEVGYGFMVLGAVCPNSILYKWKSKTTSFIASLSYAIYLTHKGIIHITQSQLKTYNIDSNSMLVIGILASVIFAYLLHIIIEKPIMKWRKKTIG